MSTKPYYHRSQRIECAKCGYRFSPMGMSRHKGSHKCVKLSEHRAARELAQQETERLLSLDKRRVIGQVVNAITSRKLQDITGLEEADTGWHDASYEYKQFWVWSWVARLWHLYRVDHATDKFYARLVRMNEATEDEREAELGLILLRIAGSK